MPPCAACAAAALLGCGRRGEAAHRLLHRAHGTPLPPPTHVLHGARQRTSPTKSSPCVLRVASCFRCRHPRRSCTAPASASATLQNCLCMPRATAAATTSALLPLPAPAQALHDARQRTSPTKSSPCVCRAAATATVTPAGPPRRLPAHPPAGGARPRKAGRARARLRAALARLRVPLQRALHAGQAGARRQGKGRPGGANVSLTSRGRGDCGRGGLLPWTAATALGGAATLPACARGEPERRHAYLVVAQALLARSSRASVGARQVRGGRRGGGAVWRRQA